MKAIIVTQSKFNELNDKAQQFCINNISGYNAIKWADELIHPVDGRIAFVVEDKILGTLTDAEKSEIIELTNDWFPVNEL